MNRLIRITLYHLGCAALVVSCATPDTYTKADKHQRYVDVYSTSDHRTALDSPRHDTRISDAIEGLEANTKRKKKDIRSWLAIANLRLARGDLDLAEQAAKRALRVNIKNMEAKKLLAQVALRRRNYDLAEILLNGIGGRSSKDSQVLNLLALIEMSRRNLSASLSLFKQALKIDPGNVSVRLNLGVTYLKYRQLHAAAIQFERVLKTMPNNSDALLHLAIIKATRGQLDDAEDIYEKILSRKENNPLALFNLAVLQQKKENYDDAVETLKTYLRKTKTSSQDADQAFALIERIKEQQVQKGSEGVSDEEIQQLANEMDRKEHNVASNAAEKEAVTEEDREIEKLENQLIDAH